MHVDLDDAGIGRHLDDAQPRVGRRQVAFDVHRQVELGGGRLDRRQQLQIVLEPFDRRHEHAEPAVARLDRKRGAHRDRCGRRLRHRRNVVSATAPAAARNCRHWSRRPATNCCGSGKRLALGERIGRHQMRLVGRRDIGQRIERQAEADRRVAGQQEQPPPAKLPHFADPAAARLRGPALHRQHVAGRHDRCRSNSRMMRARSIGSSILGSAGSMLAGSSPSLSIRSAGSSKAGMHVLGGDAEPGGEALGEPVRVVDRGRLQRLLGRDQRVVLPDRLAVASARTARTPSAAAARPDTICPARNAEPAGREAVAQAPDQLVGEDALGRPDRRGVPLRRLVVVDRHEGRLAAHGEAHVLRVEIGVDPVAQRIERIPGFVGERKRDARLLVDARRSSSRTRTRRRPLRRRR